MKGFIDIHQHSLPGLDDGAQNEKEMGQLLEADAKQGIIRVIATPHMTPGVEPIATEKFLKALGTARSYCQEHELHLRVYPGSEVLYTPGLRNAVQRGHIVTLNKTNYVLIEFLPTAEYSDIIDGLQCLTGGGYVPVLAHVERYNCLFESFSRMRKLKESYEVLYQVNASTIINTPGLRAKFTLKKCLSNELIDFVATDAHSTGKRAPHLKEAYDILVERCGVDYADQLTGDRAREMFFDL